MSTVALKGTLEYDETKKEWSWKGKWAFGSCLADATSSTPAASTSSRFLPPPASQPFQYHWKETVDPKDVPVPSLNVVIIGGEDDEEDEQEEQTPQGGRSSANTTPQKRDSSASATPTQSAPPVATITEEIKMGDETKSGAEKDSATTTTTKEQNDKQEKLDENKTSHQKPAPEDQKNEQLTDAKLTAATPSDDKKVETKEMKDVVMEDADNAEKGKPAAGEKDAQTSKKGDGSTGTAFKDAEKKIDETKKEETKDVVKKTEAPAKKSQEVNYEGNPPSESDPAFSTPASKAAMKDPPSSQFTEPKPPPVTFASVMTTFTDAAAKYKDKNCPASGKWEGFFENITGRNREKFQKVETQKVEETFNLFFNATPEADAKYAFEDASATHIPKIVHELETDPSLVQVRGCGTNQFGTFEIYGYLDLRSMVLEIQRQYVVTERRIRRRSRSTARATRQTSTRKRQPSWKRMTYNPDEDTYGRKKRARVGQQKQQGPSEPGMVIDTGSAAPNHDGQSAASDPIAGLPTDGHSVATQGATKHAFGSSSLKISLPIPGGAPTRTTGARRRNGGGTRRRSTSKSGSGVTPTGASPGMSPYIRLPTAGDPSKARWRAAHFLYYQRPEPEPQLQSADGSAPTKPNSPKVAPKPKYVVYEGELVDSKREGRGICLYSNSNLYEGEWKRDKEHGYGKLMTSDRKQIIYEGEWERGKMQGNGTYYYGSSDPSNPGSRYIGEFRESLRNGNGRYFLEGGAVYDGQWRDGAMNGRGVLTWPDNSIYDGEWKDGTRHGSGLLKTADGFVYDGQWVNNAMEGRGLAIYPSGQRYEGSWNNGRREGRGTMHFVEGAVYEGRFRDDAIDGQGTMKMSRAMEVPRTKSSEANDDENETSEEKRNDFMIPLSFQSDLTSIHNKAGFTAHGE